MLFAQAPPSRISPTNPPMRQCFCFILSFLFIVPLPTTILGAADSAPFEIQEGDRVLFLGDTLLEREGSYGYLETRMQQQFADRKFTVRNLAFSADTPLGWSRASFDPAAKGFDRLKEQLALVKPTVVFLGYGMAASLQEMTDRSNDPTLNPDPVRYGAEPMSAGTVQDGTRATHGRDHGSLGSARRSPAFQRRSENPPCASSCSRRSGTKIFAA